MRIFSYLILLVIVVFGITFACLNADPVNIDYYLGTNKLPLSLLMAFAFGLGAVFGLLVAFVPWLRLKMSNHRLRHQVKTIEKEISNLRSMPLKDAH